jgi:hypothetical protein
MKEQNDVTKVEFLMTLNNNFVVQRFFNVKGYNEKAYYHCLEDENFYFFDLDGVFTRVEDQVCLTHLQDKESHSLSIIEFQGFYPHVLTIKPFTRFTKDGYYIRWEGDLSTVK